MSEVLTYKCRWKRS